MSLKIVKRIYTIMAVLFYYYYLLFFQRLEQLAPLKWHVMNAPQSYSFIITHYTAAATKVKELTCKLGVRTEISVPLTKIRTIWIT